LKGTPSDLRKYARILRACGQAYVSGQAEDLPDDLCQQGKSDADHSGDNRHSKPFDWSGWQHHQFALEMQSPWANLLLEGKKTIETRAYSLPNALLGKKIWILQSHNGQAGVSSIPNHVDVSKESDDGGASNHGVRIVGWCKFASVKSYTDQQEFASDESEHLVTADSGYSWVAGKTQVLFGWLVKEYGTCNPDEVQRFATATRRMRSLFELHGMAHRNDNSNKTDSESVKPIQKPSNNKEHSTERKKKKRKRF
jgi:hypothetical protein